jgi:hypothetical protein
VRRRAALALRPFSPAPRCKLQHTPEEEEEEQEQEQEQEEQMEQEEGST